jgi:hypothetical protein
LVYQTCTCLRLRDKISIANVSRDGHSPKDDDSGNDAPDYSPDPPSSQSPASSANDSNCSHTHSQHISHNMSTLTHSNSGTSFARDVSDHPPHEQISEHVAFIPRSAIEEGDEFALAKSSPSAASLLDTEDRRDLGLHMPLDNESSVSMDVTHDGKVTKLVTRFELPTENEHSDASQVFRDDPPHASGSISHVGTARASVSPRKAIPAHWMPQSSGPNLATAQRAMERGHKKGSSSNSPKEAKSLRGARSVADIKKAHATEGASFLTKTAHAAVESDLTLSTFAKSPTKPQRSPTKPVWHSSTSSPLREKSPKQQGFGIDTSPHKMALLSIDTATRGHRHGTSSAATTSPHSVYHSAESSPVRSAGNLTLSFRSAAEFLADDDDIPALQLSANSEIEQTLHFRKESKPSLKLEIPLTDPHRVGGDKSPTSYASASSSSATSSNFKSSAPGSPVSRIPRVAGASSLSSARGPTRSSTLKRVQSARVLTSPKSKSQMQGLDTYKSQPVTPPSATEHDGRNLGSSGTISILSRDSPPGRLSPMDVTSDGTDADFFLAQRTQDAVGHVTSILSTKIPGFHHEYDTKSVRSRASSVSTITPASATTDPAMLDAAIIYSKKPGELGTGLKQPHRVPPIIVMMAHDFDLGTLRNTIEDSSASSATPRASMSTPLHRRAESEHGFQSTPASDLRATAPVFVPRPAPRTQQEEEEAAVLPHFVPTADLRGPENHDLDMYGIPWFYHMWQLQFAYDKGFQTGRSRSPKKNRHKKRPSSISSPPEARRPQKDTDEEQDRMPPIAKHRSQQDLRGGAAQSSRALSKAPQQPTTPTDEPPTSPFAAQKELIDRHNRYPGFRVVERLPAGFDLTTVRNVHPRPGRASTRRSDNGLYTYRGRGVPMGDTLPFPQPTAPQGRPAGSAFGREACGTVEIVYASERIAGEACQECEPDHERE